jgi:hypothetical protein
LRACGRHYGRYAPEGGSVRIAGYSTTTPNWDETKPLRSPTRGIYED